MGHAATLKPVTDILQELQYLGFLTESGAEAVRQALEAGKQEGLGASKTAALIISKLIESNWSLGNRLGDYATRAKVILACISTDATGNNLEDIFREITGNVREIN